MIIFYIFLDNVFLCLGLPSPSSISPSFYLYPLTLKSYSFLGATHGQRVIVAILSCMNLWEYSIKGLLAIL